MNKEQYIESILFQIFIRTISLYLIKCNAKKGDDVTVPTDRWYKFTAQWPVSRLCQHQGQRMRLGTSHEVRSLKPTGGV